jgi:hypothetical protein
VAYLHSLAGGRIFAVFFSNVDIVLEIHNTELFSAFLHASVQHRSFRCIFSLSQSYIYSSFNESSIDLIYLSIGHVAFDRKVSTRLAFSSAGEPRVMGPYFPPWTWDSPPFRPVVIEKARYLDLVEIIAFGLAV